MRNLDGPFESYGNDSLWLASPLRITGLFLCYKQARFVAESLRAALAQTWPMQLIVSDDGSADGTDRVLRSICQTYNGHHQVLLRCGDRNLGLIAHLNALLARAQGEIIVLFAGDDNSKLDRVERIARAALDNPEVMVFGSSFDVFTDDGSPPDEAVPKRPTLPFTLDEYLDQRDYKWMPGATMAFRRALFDEFGELPQGLWAEDITLFLRGLMLGKAQFLPQALIDYRIVRNSMSRKGFFYEWDVASVVAAHRYPLNRVAGLASTLQHDLEIARAVGWVKPAALARLEHRFVHDWTREESLHRAVVERKRWHWISPALRALAVTELRAMASKLIAIAIAPWLYFGVKFLRAWTRGRMHKQSDR